MQEGERELRFPVVLERLLPLLGVREPSLFWAFLFGLFYRFLLWRRGTLRDTARRLDCRTAVAQGMMCEVSRVFAFTQGGNPETKTLTGIYRYK